MRLRFEKRVLDLLEGAIDIHIHSAPDVYPRILNDIELALQAKDMGMRAILIKDFPVFGGIALNLSVGGLNPHAARVSLKMGAKTVWLPTLHSRDFVAKKSHVAHLAGEIGDDLRGLYVLNEQGLPKEELYPIFQLINEHDSSLATGHVSIEEAKAVVREAAKREY
jgi:hypothetical protein